MPTGKTPGSVGSGGDPNPVHGSGTLPDPYAASELGETRGLEPREARAQSLAQCRAVSGKPAESPDSNQRCPVCLKRIVTVDSQATSVGPLLIAHLRSARTSASSGSK